MATRISKVIGFVIAVPILATFLIVLSPLLLALLLGAALKHAWLASRLRILWPREKFVLVAYTDSAVWAPYIENSILPPIASHCVVVNRSREDWKRRFRAEERALAFWGGRESYNPLAIVLRGQFRVKVFRFYEAFQEYKHGRPSALEAKVAEFQQCVEAIARAAA
jgi:hypothetical protein